MKKIIAIYALTATLGACGGGGAGDGATSPAASTGTSTASQLVLIAKVDGVVAPGYPAIGGMMPTVALNSGQELEITPSASASVAANLNGAVAAIKSSTTTTYRAVLAASSNTNATLTFTPTSGSVSASSVPVSVRVAQFQSVLPRVGDSFVYSEKGEQLDGTPVDFANTTHRVNMVSADGSWQEVYLSPTNLLLSTLNLTKYGNRITMLAATSNPQGCNARGDKDGEFSPEEKLLDFPLFVNKTYSGTWLTTCGTTDSQAESMSAKVVGYEVITTSAGVFNALRIDQTTIVTNSTNTAYLGKGYTQKVSLWFDPVLGRMVKTIGQRTYESPNVTRALLTKTTIELVNYVRQAGSAGSVEPLTPANALLTSVVQPSSGTTLFADTGMYRCSDITSAQAYALYLQGHTYLDRDHDGKPCEANDITIENTMYSVPIASTGTISSASLPSTSTSGSTSTGSGGQCYVNGYRRSNGTYVQGYYRSC